MHPGKKTVEHGNAGKPIILQPDKMNLSRVVSQGHEGSSRSRNSSGASSQRSRMSSHRSALSANSKQSRSHNSAKNSAKKERKLTTAQKQLAEIEDRFKSLRHLPKQKLHPFDFPPEELEKMKVLFPEHKPIPPGMPKNAASKNQGITIY